VPEIPAGDGQEEATVISRGDQAASWSGSATGPVLAGPATTTEIGRSLEGSMLGPYRLEQFIGGGGMGAVFRALDTTLDRTVAVKVLAGRQADDEEMLKRFRNEAQSAARLDHENIGRVHAVGSEGGWHFIVFEYIEGTNLRDLVREHGPFDLARAVDVTIQVADALEHASEREVVHRDIKPSNIVITPAGRARIVDMGLARLHHLADDRDLTVSGMTLGTFDYISPEQARDPRAADVRSDLYSLGCTVFFMLVGRAPFADGTMVQKLLQHQQAKPPALDQLRSDVPRRFAEIVERLMAKDPLDRYQRPAVLVADLVAFADDQALTLASPRPLQPAASVAPQPVVARLPWLLPLAGLLALVGAMWLRSAIERWRLPAAEMPVPPLTRGWERDG
jgi:serine/threonine-protein kinase